MTPLERAAVEWHNVVATSHTSEWSFERSQAAQRRLMEAAWKAGEDAAATSATASTPPPATDEMKAMQDILVEQGLVPPKYEAGNPASATIAAPIAPPEVERLMDLARTWVAAYANAYALSMKRGTDESDWEIQERAEAALHAALIDALRTPPPQEGGNHGAEATRQQSSAPAVRDGATTVDETLRPDIWSAGHDLQIDSYATGRQIVHADIHASHIALSLTDGGTSWSGKVPLPDGWWRYP